MKFFRAYSSQFIFLIIGILAGFFISRLPIKFEEKNIGHTGVLQQLTIVLEESYQLVPVEAVVILSPKSVSSVRKLARSIYIK